MLAKKNSVPAYVLVIIYLLSVLLLFINRYIYLLNETEYYQISLFSVNVYVAKSLNFVFLIINTLLIQNIFANKDRRINGSVMAFIYLLLNNKIWLFDTINNYLISDLLVLVSLFMVNPQKTKKQINLLIFYFSFFFGIIFLSGVSFIYTFVIPMFIFNLFLISDWKSWIIFILGFVLPAYFFTAISWLLNADPFLYLRIITEHSLYRLNHLSTSDFHFSGELQWKNIGIAITIVLLLVSGTKELKNIYYYSTSERKIALFFLILMFFSFMNYLLIYLHYHKYASSVIALPFAYYMGILLNQTNSKIKYFILLLLLVLTIFM